uniref:Tubulin polyglutamylase complex subunit 1 n=1 Tax=Anas platyrhynchos TaxID=8839 RepID=A0A8B9SU15_ANAPL
MLLGLFGFIWIYLDVFGSIWFYSDYLCPEAVPVALSRCPQWRPRPRPAATAAAPRPRPGPRRRGAPCPEQPGRLAAPLPTLKMAARGLARRRRPSAMATASLPLIGCARRGRRRARHADWLPVLKIAARELPAPADCSARGQNGGGPPSPPAAKMAAYEKRRAAAAPAPGGGQRPGGAARCGGGRRAGGRGGVPAAERRHRHGAGGAAEGAGGAARGAGLLPGRLLRAAGAGRPRGGRDGRGAPGAAAAPGPGAVVRAPGPPLPQVRAGGGGEREADYGSRRAPRRRRRARPWSGAPGHAGSCSSGGGHRGKAVFCAPCRGRTAFNNNISTAYEVLGASGRRRRPGVDGRLYSELLRRICQLGAAPQEVSGALLRRVQCRDHEAVPFDVFRYGVLTCSVLLEFVAKAHALYDVLDGGTGAADKRVCQAVLRTLEEALGGGDCSVPVRYLEAGSKLGPDCLALVMDRALQERKLSASMSREEFLKKATALFVAKGEAC